MKHPQYHTTIEIVRLYDAVQLLNKSALLTDKQKADLIIKIGKLK